MTIENTQLTTGEVEGRGLYDELMRATNAHLRSELDAGRITGASYAEVYLGMMQANLQTAAQFVLQKGINSQQEEVLQEEVRKSQKEIQVMTAQIDKLVADAGLTTEQKNLLIAQTAETNSKKALIDQQRLSEVERTALITAQKNKEAAQTLLVTKQEDLVDQQIITERANTIDPTGGILKAEFDHKTALAALTGQKKVTEEAQTQNPATYDHNAETGGGLIGSQMSLYKLQKEGFKRDAEQKAAKIYSDSWAVTQNLTGSPQTSAYGFAAANVKDVLDQLRGGVNLGAGSL